MGRRRVGLTFRLGPLEVGFCGAFQEFEPSAVDAVHTPMLLCLALLLQDALDAEDIEARETAAAELLRRGPETLPELRRRREEARDPEVRARLGDVVARLETDVRRRSFGGGNEVGGLRARLVPLEKPLDGHPPLRLEIMNMDAVVRTFVPVEDLDTSLPRETYSSSGAHGRLTVRRLNAPPPTNLRHTTACGGAPSRTRVPLRPGESRFFDELLDERLEAGAYEASVTYYAKRLLGAAEDLVSDTVRFEIKD